MTAALAAIGALIVACAWPEADTGPVRVGSKSFTESYLLAEIVARLVEGAGEVGAARRFGLGGTGIVYRALETGEIESSEYTGTISRCHPRRSHARDALEALREPLRRRASR